MKGKMLLFLSPPGFASPLSPTPPSPSWLDSQAQTPPPYFPDFQNRVEQILFF